jgi:methanogenic corrinoid protein MtbC1
MEFLESTNRRLIDPVAIGLAGSSSAPAPTVSPQGDPSHWAGMREEFERAILSGNEGEARRILSSWYARNGGIVSVADDLIAPVFRSVGELWECGDLEVYQERRGCEICIRLIHELRRLLAEPSSNAPLAMGGTASGDQYQIPTQLIDMTFREAGWRSVNLGCDLPFTSLLSAARKHMPKIFWLSVSYVSDEAKFIAECEQFAKQLPKGVLFTIGGAALYEGLRRRMTFSSYSDNMQQLAYLARAIKAGLPPTSPQI